MNLDAHGQQKTQCQCYLAYGVNQTSHSIRGSLADTYLMMTSTQSGQNTLHRETHIQKRRAYGLVVDLLSQKKSQLKYQQVTQHST